MVLFGFIVFVSVVALLGARALDIECERPVKPRAAKAVWVDQRAGFPAETMGLRQI